MNSSFSISLGIMLTVFILLAIFVFIDIYMNEIIKWINNYRIKIFVETIRPGDIFQYKSDPKREVRIVDIQDGEVFYQLLKGSSQYIWSLPILSFMKRYTK